MSRKKLRIKNTDAENLVANLRGEVGEIVTSWVLMRRYTNAARQISSGDDEKDIQNPDLNVIHIMESKLEDEIVARLSELAEEKIGRLNFYFAGQKLDILHREIDAFAKFIINERIREKRNQHISHKELPERRADHRPILIPYPILLHAVAMALRIMKKIDRKLLGPSAPFLWRETRKRRYQFLFISPHAAYMLVPYLNLSGYDRIQVLREEIREGFDVWSEMGTTINGQSTKILVCKKWGVILLGDQLLPLNQYPLVSLSSIQLDESPRIEGPTEPQAT